MEATVEHVMHTVPQVFLNKFPFQNKPSKCAKYFLPVVENLFSMMAPGPVKGSQAWLEHLRRNISDASVPDVVGNEIHVVVHTIS